MPRYSVETVVGMARSGWEVVRAEAQAVGFKWRPTIVVACATLALLITWRHDNDNPFIHFLRWVGGEGWVRASARYGLDYTVVARVGLPILVILALRDKFSEYGLGLGDVRKGLLICGIFYVVYIPGFIVLFRNAEFQRQAAWVTAKYTTWTSFLGVEAVRVFFLCLRTEFLYRGFLLFGVKKEYGAYAGVLVQLVPYVLLHSENAPMEAVGSLPVGLALGYCAVRTGSIWYGLFLHGSIALMFSALTLFMHFHAWT